MISNRKTDKASITSVVRTASLSCAAALILTACTTEQQNRGYIPIAADSLDSLTVGLDNVNSVRDTLGRPTLTGTFDDRTWYYISTQTVIKSIFHEEPIGHQVVALHFDENGILESRQDLGMEDMNEINPVADKTPTRGKELGFFEQIFGNIGRFSAPPGGGGGR